MIAGNGNGVNLRKKGIAEERNRDMARLPRFFITPEQVNGTIILVTDEDVRHITTVLRMQTGDELLLCDGKGTEYRARITAIGKQTVTGEVLDRRARTRKGPDIVLGQGIAKADKMDWIVQKATEIGATSIVPLETERTIVKVKDGEKRISRWQKICREAAMQSHRSDIPKVEAITSFADFLRTLNSEPGTLFLIPWEEAVWPVKEVLRSHPDVKKVVVLIGPEGGFSRKEADLAAARGFHAVSLGSNILRTETAALAAIALIGYEYF